MAQFCELHLLGASQDFVPKPFCGTNDQTRSQTVIILAWYDHHIAGTSRVRPQEEEDG
jgi:hypothetical protein